MASISPSFENIKQFKVQPTIGESTLLKFLYDHLDDSYEIHFQPWINGDNPDIIILRKGCGVFIIEVKDWSLNDFNVNDKKSWQVKKNGAMIISPLEQVFHYKQNLYNLHINKLLELNIKNSKHFAFINCGIYFHKETKKNLYKFCVSSFQKDSKYKKFLSYFEMIGNDTLTESELNQILSRRKLKKLNPLFTDEIYYSFKRYLQPTWHQLECGIPINYSKRQKEFLVSQDKQQKIRGVAGSGKSMLLAGRAINANKRTASKILILTFNISLRNYLHDKLSEVRENFNWGDFEILHYHEFIRTQAINHNLPILKITDYSNESLFENVKNRIHKYRAIFIDEVQDYENEWLKIIKRYFLEDIFEYVVFADEKQNIYDRKLEKDRKPYTGVPGAYWNELKESFRLSNAISNFANEFQVNFFTSKYDIDKIVPVQLGLPFDNDKQIVKYYFKDKREDTKKYFNEIYELIESNSIHPNNVCFLAPNVSELRKIDYLIRTERNEKTMIMFETLETYFHLLLIELETKQVDFYNKLLNQFKNSRSEIIEFLCLNEFDNINSKQLNSLKSKFNFNSSYIKSVLNNIEIFIKSDDNKALQDTVKDIRRNKKFHFWMNPGTMKLSTVHSFKGWEIHTLVLIISQPEKNGIEEEHIKEFISDELIYTALTRCRYNLIVVNLGIQKYHKFFQENLSLRSK